MGIEWNTRREHHLFSSFGDLVLIDGFWYFFNANGRGHGPYSTKEEALQVADRYARAWMTAKAVVE